MQRYFARMRYDLIVFVDISGPKVDDNVNDEHDVHNEINDSHGLNVKIERIEERRPLALLQLQVFIIRYRKLEALSKKCGL